MSNTDVLGIVKRFREDGSYIWSVRGTGVTYSNLYKWLYTVSLKNVYDDFPWDNFEFVHKSDEDYMVRNYAKFIYED